MCSGGSDEEIKKVELEVIQSRNSHRRNDDLRDIFRGIRHFIRRRRRRKKGNSISSWVNQFGGVINLQAFF